MQNGLDSLTYLADRMGHDFRPYISTIIQPTIDRLGECRLAIYNSDKLAHCFIDRKNVIAYPLFIGDNKDLTREKAQLMLLKILERGSMSPQQLLDKLHPTFSHKNAKLREEALILLTTCLNE